MLWSHSVSQIIILDDVLDVIELVTHSREPFNETLVQPVHASPVFMQLHGFLVSRDDLCDDFHGAQVLHIRLVGPAVLDKSRCMLGCIFRLLHKTVHLEKN